MEESLEGSCIGLNGFMPSAVQVDSELTLIYVDTLSCHLLEKCVRNDV